MPFPDQLQPTPPPVEPDLYSFPKEFRVGDTFKFRVANTSVYPDTAGWTFSLSIRGGGTSIDIASVLDSGDFLLTKAAAVTSGWVAGHYSWQLYAVNGDSGERITVDEGYLTIRPNLSAAAANADQRSHARRTLDLIEALIEGRATNDIIQSTIDATQFTRMSLDQLLKAHSYYTAKVRSEEAKARAKSGLGTGRLILTRFVAPH